MIFMFTEESTCWKYFIFPSKYNWAHESEIKLFSSRVSPHTTDQPSMANLVYKINMIALDRSQVLSVSFHCCLEGRTKPRLILSLQTSLRQVQMKTRRCVPLLPEGGTIEWLASHVYDVGTGDGGYCSEFKFRRKKSYIRLLDSKEHTLGIKRPDWKTEG